jgi:hypothetical protein
VPLSPLFKGIFGGQPCKRTRHVAAKPVEHPSDAALGFSANLLIIATTLNRPFANEASLLSRIRHWRLQFRVTARVATHAMHGKLGHRAMFRISQMSVSVLAPSDCRCESRECIAAPRLRINPAAAVSRAPRGVLRARPFGSVTGRTSFNFPNTDELQKRTAGSLLPTGATWACGPPLVSNTAAPYVGKSYFVCRRLQGALRRP